MIKAKMTEWVKALRSGKYKQGTGRLHDPVGNTYCCLGVLGKISDMPRDALETSDVIRDFYRGTCGIKTARGDFKAGVAWGDLGNLAGANDAGKSFKEIADFIEKNYKIF